MNALLPLCLAGLVSGATSPEPPREVSLEIKYDKLLTNQVATAAEDTVFFVRDDGSKRLREQHGVEQVRTDGDTTLPAIVVTLWWIDYEDSVYGVDVATRRPGEDAKALEQFRCECIDSELSAAVQERLGAALVQLAEEPAEPDSSDPAQPVPETTSTPDPQPEAERKPRAPLGGMGKAGIGLLSAGVVGLVAGGIVFAQGRQLDEVDARGFALAGSDYRPPGIAVMVTGGVLAATGAVLLVVDRVRAKKKAARTTLVPTPSGLAVVGRF